MRIAIGSDHHGVRLHDQVRDLLRRLGHEVIEVGDRAPSGIDYLDLAAEIARRVSCGEVDRGILISSTGLGTCMVANKFPGVRAAPCHDELTAELSRRHNDLNVLCLPGDVLAERPIDRLIEIWLNTAFEGGRHARRIQKIRDLERPNNH